jgi:hypothetical protein
MPIAENEDDSVNVYVNKYTEPNTGDATGDETCGIRCKIEGSGTQQDNPDAGTATGGDRQ